MADSLGDSDIEPSPAGWKLVPIEPTSRMLLAGHRGGGKNCSCGMVYRAMLDAAPEPPQHIAEVMVCARAGCEVV